MYASDSDFNNQRITLLKNMLGEIRTQQEYLSEPVGDNVKMPDPMISDWNRGRPMVICVT